MEEKEYKRALLPLSLKSIFLDKCSLCPLSEKSYPVRPRGSWEAKTIWLGEAAGKEEEKENCSFCGPAGRLSSEGLKEVGLSFDENFFSPNICLCRPHPLGESGKENRTPAPEEMESCRPNLNKILTLHEPKLIVLVGGTSLKAILREKITIGKAVGRFFPPNSYDLPVDADLYAIYHPAFILRNMSRREDWITQLTRLKDYMRGRELV